MNTEADDEQRFIAEADAFDVGGHSAGHVLQALQSWLARLESGLRGSHLDDAGLKTQGALARLAHAIDLSLRDSMRTWPLRQARLEEIHALSDAFDDQVLLLVFGKFNAGKSSLCNFIADRFAAHGKAVRYFHLASGRVEETQTRLHEGGTETTFQLQGVCLGARLVLLDTPGLHSANQENAALTQRFIDSADGGLWLTSSTSPGQVQELDELGRELLRGKALLPVVTRSDRYEEYEVDGEIRKVLCNKTEENRLQQEADVEVRAAEKLVTMGAETALLKKPVSLSVHMARLHGQTPAAMSEAGFHKLYAALTAMAKPVLVYKRRKKAEIFLHYLEESVQGMLGREVQPLLDELNAASEIALNLLERQREQIVDAVWRGVMPTLPDLLDAHAAARDVAAVRASLSRSIFEACVQEAGSQLADYEIVADSALSRIELDDDAGFEEIVIAEPGRAADEEHLIVIVGYERLYASLEKSVRASLSRISGDMVRQCRESIEHLMEQAARLDHLLRDAGRDLLDLKRDLRAE